MQVVDYRSWIRGWVGHAHSLKGGKATPGVLKIRINVKSRPLLRLYIH